MTEIGQKYKRRNNSFYTGLLRRRQSVAQLPREEGHATWVPEKDDAVQLAQGVRNVEDQEP